MESKAKVMQDYSRNAISDYESGDVKAGNYEKKKALEMGAGEGMSMKNSEMKVEKQMSMMGPSMYGSPAKMNNSPMQMKGSWMSKHCSK